jgi:uncharacterized protein
MLTSDPHECVDARATRFSGSVTIPAGPLPAGIGLKSQHFHDILDTRPALGFLEIHAENFLVDGGPFHHYLTRLREHYPLSIHGVGLSIGGATRPDTDHLKRLAQLIDRYQPQSFSEHLAWSTHSDIFFNDLLPLAYNAHTLARVSDHIDIVQNALGRKILLENPSTYVEFSDSTIDEPEFIAEVVRASGCGLLLDVNNVHVSCTNHRNDARDYLRALPLARVEEIHLAGFTDAEDIDGTPLLIDSHGSPVAREVWALYAVALAHTGAVATLIERDNDVPPLVDLLLEAERANEYLRSTQRNNTYCSRDPNHNSSGDKSHSTCRRRG